jgi:hypothetical protein
MDGRRAQRRQDADLMPWMACIPLMQEQLTVCEEWNWLQKNSIERSVPPAEGAWSVFGYFLLTKKYQWTAH